MNNFSSSLNPIQEQIRLLQQCPVCKGQYDAKQARILEDRGEAHLVHITCPHCQNAILAVIVSSPIGMSSVGMMTDLNEADVKRLRRRGALTEDEVLNFHSFLVDKKFIFNNN